MTTLSMRICTYIFITKVNCTYVIVFPRIIFCKCTEAGSYNIRQSLKKTMSDCSAKVSRLSTIPRKSMTLYYLDFVLCSMNRPQYELDIDGNCYFRISMVSG
jgi:hypothetical protein